MICTVPPIKPHKYQSWILHVVKQNRSRYLSTENNNKQSNPKYVCKILQMHYNYKSSNNTTYKCNIQMIISDGKHTIPAYIKITNNTQPNMYTANQIIILTEFRFQMDHSKKQIHLCILKSQLCNKNIFSHHYYNAQSTTDIHGQLTDTFWHISTKTVNVTVRKQTLTRNYCILPKFKKPTYSMTSDTNNKRKIYYDKNKHMEQEFNTPSKKRQKLNQNCLKSKHILAHDEMIKNMLKAHDIFVLSLKSHEKNNESKQNAFSDKPIKRSGLNKNAFADEILPIDKEINATNSFSPIDKEINATNTPLTGFADNICSYSPSGPMFLANKHVIF
eukprot:401396_1